MLTRRELGAERGDVGVEFDDSAFFSKAAVNATTDPLREAIAPRLPVDVGHRVGAAQHEGVVDVSCQSCVALRTSNKTVPT